MTVERADLAASLSLERMAPVSGRPRCKGSLRRKTEKANHVAVRLRRSPLQPSPWKKPPMARSRSIGSTAWPENHFALRNSMPTDSNLTVHIPPANAEAQADESLLARLG
jgi:hypothetical protein